PSIFRLAISNSDNSSTFRIYITFSAHVRYYRRQCYDQDERIRLAKLLYQLATIGSVGGFSKSRRSLPRPHYHFSRKIVGDISYVKRREKMFEFRKAKLIPAASMKDSGLDNSHRQDNLCPPVLSPQLKYKCLLTQAEIPECDVFFLLLLTVRHLEDCNNQSVNQSTKLR
ncbi:unnamed protein product, partial [Albugo candida]